MSLLGGTMWGWEPTMTFDQDNQKAIPSGGALAVTAMAGAAAVVLAETVIGSVVSAGAIAFVGGVAVYYIGQHGVCPGNKELWVAKI